MKKTFVALSICLLVFVSNAFLAHCLDIESELQTYNIEELDGYTDGDTDFYTDGAGFFDTVRRFVRGDEVLNVKNVLKAIVTGFFSEAKGCFSTLVSILAISLLFSLLNNIKGEFNSATVSETAFFVCYLLLATQILKVFADVASLVTSSVKSVSVFISAAAPVLMTMLITTGAISAAATINPTILFAAQIVTIVAEKFFIPLLYSSTALYIVSEVNETIKVSKFADFLKKTVRWSLSLILTIFVSVLGIQGFCSATLDTTAAKTARYLVGTAVPVVGGIISETLETVVGCSRVIKNATGATGVIVVLVIATAPILKILAVSTAFYLGAAVLEPITDRRISNMMSSVASVTSLMAAIIVTIAVLFIICIGMVMCIGNTT